MSGSVQGTGPRGARRRALRGLSLAQRARHEVRIRRGGNRRAGAERGAFYDGIWHDAAAELGASVQPLGGGLAEIRRDGVTVRVWKNLSPVDSQVVLNIAGDKPLVYRLLAERGVRVPRHVTFTLDALHQAVRFQREIGGDCVVKPARNTGGGLGVATGIRGRRTLIWAAAAAAAHCPELLIEEQLSGNNYRLLFMDGELIHAVRRDPPTVVGDGASTVRDLVDAMNAARLQTTRATADAQVSCDLDMRQTLAREGLTLQSVPAAGRRVSLKTVINQNGAPDNRPAGADVCDAVVEEAARAGEAVGARLVGIDVITTDARRPLGEVGGAILEVNTTPGLHIHGAATAPVVREILRRLLVPQGEPAGQRLA